MAILIVDDEHYVRLNIMESLKAFLPNDTVIEQAGNGYEAIQIIQKTPIKLMITDIKMPKMDGNSLMKKLSELPQDLIPKTILVVSGHISEKNHIKPNKKLAYLSKPFRLKTFKKYVNQLLVSAEAAIDLDAKKEEEEIKTFKQKELKKYQKLIEEEYKGMFIGYTFEEQKKVLHKIGSRDEKLCNKIKRNIEYLDKTRFLTKNMKQQVLQELSYKSLAIALRLCTQDVVLSLLDGTSKNVKSEILKYLKEPQSPSTVATFQEEIITYLKKKEAQGKIIMDEDSHDTYV